DPQAEGGAPPPHHGVDHLAAHPGGGNQVEHVTTPCVQVRADRVQGVLPLAGVEGSRKEETGRHAGGPGGSRTGSGGTGVRPPGEEERRRTASRTRSRISGGPSTSASGPCCRTCRTSHSGSATR